MATEAPTQAPATTRAKPESRKIPFGAHSTGRRDWATWPRYEAAVLGFRGYWYPVTWSKHVREGRAPVMNMLAGERLYLRREKGRVIVGGEKEYPAAERLGLIWVFLGEVA